LDIIVALLNELINGGDCLEQGFLRLLFIVDSVLQEAIIPVDLVILEDRRDQRLLQNLHRLFQAFY